MEKLNFFLTDVFGNEKYSGNQLATFINCGNLTTKEMQKIASEINFSETTFIVSNEKKNGGYDVRIFTPAAEVDFAGHPTLGTAYIIHKYFENSQSNQVNLNLKVGQISVDIDNGIYMMHQKQPVFGNLPETGLLAKSLNIPINYFDDKFPIQEVSTGLGFIIAPLKNLKALKSAGIQVEYHNQLMNASDSKGIFIFCPEKYSENHQLSSRMFAPMLGIVEDPATGSATGCLAAYLLKYNYFNKQKINLKVGQGYEIGRPSELIIDAEINNEGYKIFVGGKVIEIAEGNWKL